MRSQNRDRLIQLGRKLRRVSQPLLQLVAGKQNYEFVPKGWACGTNARFEELDLSFGTKGMCSVDLRIDAAEKVTTLWCSVGATPVAPFAVMLRIGRVGSEDEIVWNTEPGIASRTPSREHQQVLLELLEKLIATVEAEIPAAQARCVDEEVVSPLELSAYELRRIFK